MVSSQVTNLGSWLPEEVMSRDREYTYAKKGVTRHKLPRRRRDRSIEHLSASKSFTERITKMLIMLTTFVYFGSVSQIVVYFQIFACGVPFVHSFLSLFYSWHLQGFKVRWIQKKRKTDLLHAHELHTCIARGNYRVAKNSRAIVESGLPLQWDT